MTIGSRVSLVLVVTMGLSGIGFVGAVLAQNPHSAPPSASQLKSPAAPQTSGSAESGMMATMRADQKKLDDLVAVMNGAARADKLDRVAAVITEIVAQHSRMVEHMGSMHEAMMQKMMKSGDQKMPGSGQAAPPIEHEQHHPQQ